MGRLWLMTQLTTSWLDNKLTFMVAYRVVQWRVCCFGNWVLCQRTSCSPLELHTLFISLSSVGTRRSCWRTGANPSFTMFSCSTPANSTDQTSCAKFGTTHTRWSTRTVPPSPAEAGHCNMSPDTLAPTVCPRERLSSTCKKGLRYRGVKEFILRLVPRTVSELGSWRQHR